MTSILGISAFFHDSAAAIIQDGAGIKKTDMKSQKGLN